MNQWVYKSTEFKLDRPRTLMLATSRRFLCRSAFTAGGSKVPYVRDVEVGDLMHFYHRDERKLREVGSFHIVDKAGHPYESAVGAKVPGTALFIVEDPNLVTQIDKDGDYEPDRVMGKFTGWLLSKDVGNTPVYSEKMFGRQQTLAPYPRP